jgi:GNAT superfamily N-acetyltransferase
MPGLEGSGLPVQALVRIVAQRKRPVDLITELGLEELAARPLISRTTRLLRHLGIEVSKMKTAEAIRRYREGEARDPVFEQLLGIEMKREQDVQGRVFCDFVVEQTDEATLTTMWDSAEAMPSLPEIESRACGSPAPCRRRLRRMTIEIRQATPERVPQLADVLGRTFATDPLAVWPMAPGSGQVEVSRFFALYDKELVDDGWLWEAGEAAGVALWVPPGGGARYTEVDEGITKLAVRDEFSDDEGVRYETLWNSVWEHMPEEPHWLLDHLAVEPDQQGRGIGGALVRIGLEWSERDGVPAFLETSKPRNVPLYEHLGFRVEAAADAPRGGPHVWFMRFDP